MKFNTHTTNKIAEVVTLRAELDKLTTPLAKALADDRTDIDKAAGTLATLQARRDILAARIDRRKSELFTMIVNEARDAHEAANKAHKAAQRVLAEQREAWQGEVKARFGKTAGEMMNGHALTPSSIVDGQKTMDEAYRLLADADAVRSSVDAAWHDSNRGAALNTSYVRPDFFGNALRLAGVA